MKKETLGLLLGLMGVTVFAITLPMTRLATGTADAPLLSPWFVTFARAVLAGGLSIAVLLATRSPWPQAEHRAPLLMAVLGNALGFRFFRLCAAAGAVQPRGRFYCFAATGDGSGGGLGARAAGALGLLAVCGLGAGLVMVFLRYAPPPKATAWASSGPTPCCWVPYWLRRRAMCLVPK